MKLRQQSPDVRRPPLHAMTYDRRRCRGKSNVPMCSDDDWVSKCPSGCRLQAFISQMESQVERKLRTVCKTAKMYEDAAEKSMKAMTHIYSHNRRVIINKYMSELKFVEHTEGLARNFSLLLKKSSRLSKQLEELNHKVKEQLDEMYRTEVDIDMTLRACQGSCHVVVPFSVSHHSYETLQADMEQMAFHQKRKAAIPPQDLPHVKLQPVDVGQVSSGEYKSIPTVQRELLTQFEDIGQNQILLEQLLEESTAVDADTPSELE
ncbi:fibrinogen alpha chain isoform X1 [Labrus mixtus]|uniref:fibrinogen alpha chain isoform X1 n=2 Tax=Labrus mixtus TaxID=508554 RepID=UPI0029C0CBFE|nr:fibrinogen alpha chain isoform X1 [Labrus mixtus]